MKNKNRFKSMQYIAGIAAIAVTFALLLTSCTGGAQAKSGGGKTLDQAIAEAAARIDERVEAGSKIALLNFSSPADRFSAYVLDELTGNLVDTGKLIVVDRAEVDLIRSEFEFQLSGEVGDSSMQELGQMLGAQSIVTGSLTEVGDEYRIVIRVLNVQSAAVAVQYRTDLASSSRIKSLLAGGRSGGAANTAASTSGGRVQASPGSSGTASGGTAGAGQAAVPENKIISSNAGWKDNVDGGNPSVINGTSANINFTREIIQNREVDVMTLGVTLARGNAWRIGEFTINNNAVIQQLKSANGIRFSVLGDGQEGWKVMFPIRETSIDYCYHEMAFSTANGRVIYIDVPFTKLTQQSWGRKATFNKNNIVSMIIQRYAGDNDNLNGFSTIKIFDFEIF